MKKAKYRIRYRKLDDCWITYQWLKTKLIRIVITADEYKMLRNLEKRLTHAKQSVVYFDREYCDYVLDLNLNTSGFLGSLLAKFFITHTIRKIVRGV